MVKKRFNMRFDPILWELLAKIAKERKTSVSELIRIAMKERLAREESNYKVI